MVVVVECRGRHEGTSPTLLSGVYNAEPVVPIRALYQVLYLYIHTDKEYKEIQERLMLVLTRCQEGGRRDGCFIPTFVSERAFLQDLFIFLWIATTPP